MKNVNYKKRWTPMISLVIKTMD